MRTHIKIDDDLLEAMRLLRTRTKRATVDAALRVVVCEAQREAAIYDMRGLGWNGELDATRKGRRPG